MKRLIPFVYKSLLAIFIVAGFSACSSSQKKPTKLMIYASAAEKAAKAAGAERKAPDPFRKAENAIWRARTAYTRKQWTEAARSATLARRYFEMAELNAEVRSALGGGGGFY